MQDSDEEDAPAMPSPNVEPVKDVIEIEDTFDFEFDSYNESALLALNVIDEHHMQSIRREETMPPPAPKPIKRKLVDENQEVRRSKIARIDDKTQETKLMNGISATPLFKTSSSPVKKPGQRRRALPVLSEDAQLVEAFQPKHTEKQSEKQGERRDKKSKSKKEEESIHCQFASRLLRSFKRRYDSIRCK